MTDEKCIDLLSDHLCFAGTRLYKHNTLDLADVGLYMYADSQMANCAFKFHRSTVGLN